MINTKDNIWIEGFDTKIDLLTKSIQLNDRNIIYSGKTSEIREEIAKECVMTYYSGYFDYRPGNCNIHPCREFSIYSSLEKPDGTTYEYCMIWWKK